MKAPRKKFRKQGVGRISTGLHHPAGQEPENDVWRRLERAFVAGKLRPGQSIRVGELRSMAKAGAQCMLSLQLRLAEQRSLLLLVEEEEGYRVEARFGARTGRPDGTADFRTWARMHSADL